MKITGFKNLLGLLFVLSLVNISCSKDEMIQYHSEKDGIHFDYKKDQFKSIFDFAFQSEDVLDEWGYPMPHYFGDSLLTHKAQLIVSLLGRESAVDRKFKLKANQGEGLSPELIQFEDSYTFRAGRLIDTIEVTLKRPVKRGTYNVQVTFDHSDANADFSMGVEEKSHFTFQLKDRYPEPEDWEGRVDWLGAYSEEKYAFIVSVLHITYGYYVDWGEYNEQLREALEQYNQKHPNNPKAFTFPVNTDSIWWF